MAQELNVLALNKGGELHIFVYDDGSREAVVTELFHQAADPGRSLTWFDAAVLVARVRRPAAEPEDHS